MLPVTTLVVGGISDGAQQVFVDLQLTISGCSSTTSPLRQVSAKSAIRRHQYLPPTCGTHIQAA
jgi:hypothetical protein